MKYTFKEVWNVKESPNPWISTLILKPITTFLTWINVNLLGIRPDLITYLGLIPGILSAYFFYVGNFLWGPIFFVMTHIFDCLDGKTARIINQTSKFGAFLDNYVGFINRFLIIVGFAWGQYFITSNKIWLFLAPILVFLLIFHIIIATTMTLKLGTTTKQKLIEKSENKSLFGLVEKFQKKLILLELQEPLNIQDVMYLIFFFGPIFSYFHNMLLELVIVCLGIILIKEIFWFIYYKHLLNLPSK